MVRMVRLLRHKSSFDWRPTRRRLSDGRQVVDAELTRRWDEAAANAARAAAVSASLVAPYLAFEKAAIAAKAKVNMGNVKVNTANAANAVKANTSKSGRNGCHNGSEKQYRAQRSQPMRPSHADEEHESSASSSSSSSTSSSSTSSSSSCESSSLRSSQAI